MLNFVYFLKPKYVFDLYWYNKKVMFLFSSHFTHIVYINDLNLFVSFCELIVSMKIITSLVNIMVYHINQQYCVLIARKLSRIFLV